MKVRAAFLLAAGRGERMRPLTARRAKPALPVLGLPILARIARGLAAQGIETFAANAHHAPDSVRAALGREATIFVEPELMGSGGAFAAPAAWLGAHDAFLVHNGDTLVDVPVAALAAAAAGARRLGALLVRPGATPGYGGVVLDPAGAIVGRYAPGEPPSGGAPATYLGTGVIRRELLDAVPRDRPSELFPEIVLPLLAQGWTLGAVAYTGRFLEFTGPRDYLRNLLRLVRAGRSALAAELPGGAAAFERFANATVFRSNAPGTGLSAGMTLDGAIVLEAGAVAQRGSMLRNVVLLEGAEVEWAARLDNVVVDAGCLVRHGSGYHDGVLYRTEAGEHVFRPFAD